MTIFNHVRSTSILRIAAPVLAIALAVAIPALPQGKGKGGRGGPPNDPDRVVAGASLPAGWAMLTDGPRGADSPAKVTEAGGKWEFIMGAAGTFYNNSWTKSGNYKYSARVKLTASATHPTSYGLMFGGSNMKGGMPVYSYFLVHDGGDYFIANQDNGKVTKLVDWTMDPAVHAADKKLEADVLGVEVKGDNVIFSINGKEVKTLPKAQVHTDGLIGFRIGHNIDVNIDQVTK